MKATLTTSAYPSGGYQITSAFKDEDGDDVTPNAGLTWTLKDDKGDVINSRTAVAMTEAASIETWLTGDDLASQGVEDNGLRVFSLDGTIDSDGVANIPIDSAVIFPIDVLVPVSLRQAKEHCRISAEDTEHDIYLCRVITAARQKAEQYLRRKLMTQTVTYYFDGWPDSNVLELPYGKKTTVTTIKYKDTDGDQTTWDSDEYIDEVGNTFEPSRVVLAYGYSWPSVTLYPSKPIEVIYSCGYGADTGDVPGMIIHAIKLIIGDLFINRETVVINMTPHKLNTIEDLLYPYRLWRF